MNKILKISIILITILCITVILSNTVFATTLQKITEDTEIGTTLRDEAAPVGNKIVGYIKIIGMFIAVIMLMIVGIKYMLGSVEEKAEYKQTAILYILGAVLLFASAACVDLIYNALN